MGQKKIALKEEQFHLTVENLHTLCEEILTEKFKKIQKWISLGINLDEK